MIKNIIFDLGNVLISYNPKTYIAENVKEENQKKFYEIVFGGEEWQKLDRGVLEYEEAVEIFSKKLPQEKEAIINLFKNKINGVLFPVDKNLKILPTLKAKGYKLYILSNFHREAFLSVSKINKFDILFDGKIVSYEVKLLKPEEEIYLKLIKKYGLKPEETLFIDDTLVNIEAAKKIGIETIHLTEKDKLKEELSNILELDLSVE